MKLPRKHLRFPFRKKPSDNSALTRHSPAEKKVINAVELGPAEKAVELKGFLKKPGRELHGIDRALTREEVIQRNNSVLWLRKGSFYRKLKAYKPESVRQFRMKIVLSYQGKPGKIAKKYTGVFRQVFEKLVPGGRFQVSERREYLEAIRPILEGIGFRISVFKPAGKNETTSFWQKVYAWGTEKPWVLTAVKPREKPAAKNASNAAGKVF